MSAVDEALRKLAGEAASPPAPLGQLRDRAGRRRRRRRAVRSVAATAMVLAVVLGSVQLRGDDDAADVRVTDRTTTTVQGARQLWRVAGAPAGLAAPLLLPPVIADGLVVVAGGFDGQGRVVGYDQSTGATRWEYDTGADSAFIIGANGSSLLVAPQYGTVISLDVRSGTERWRFGLAGGEQPLRANVTDGTAYLGTTRPIEGDVGSPHVYALELASGAERWRAVLDPGTDLTWGAPAVADGAVYVTDTLSHPGSAPTTHLHALDQVTGQRRWRFDLESQGAGLHDWSPLAGGGQVHVVGQDRVLFTVDAATGRELWRAGGGEAYPWLGDLRDGILYASVDEELVAFDAVTGERRWSSSAPVAGLAPLVAKAVPDEGALYVAAGGRAAALDLDDGAIRWEDAIRTGTESSGLNSQLVTDQDVVVSGAGVVMVLDRESGRERWQRSVGSGLDSVAATDDFVAVLLRNGGLLGLTPE